MGFQKKKLLHIILPVVFFLFIVWIIWAANTGTEHIFTRFVRQIPLGDKISHLFLYGIMAWLINISLHPRKINIFINIPLGSILILTFAIIEEFSQIWISKRNFDWMDMLFDVLGIGAFTLLYLYTKK